MLNFGKINDEKEVNSTDLNLHSGSTFTSCVTLDKLKNPIMPVSSSIKQKLELNGGKQEGEGPDGGKPQAQSHCLPSGSAYCSLREQLLSTCKD